MRRIVLAMVMPVLQITSISAATPQDLYIRRPDGSYRGFTAPAPTPGRPYEARPVPGTGSSAIYDSRGRRIGTVEHGAVGPAFRDNRGRRQ